jgi:hypothetical protein
MQVDAHAEVEIRLRRRADDGGQVEHHVGAGRNGFRHGRRLGHVAGDAADGEGGVRHRRHVEVEQCQPGDGLAAQRAILCKPGRQLAAQEAAATENGDPHRFLVFVLWCRLGRQIAVLRGRGQVVAMTEPLPFRLFCNPRQGVPGVVVLPQGGFRRAAAEIRAWPGYAPTPLLPLAEVAAAAGVAAVHGKDDQGRSGQGGAGAVGSRVAAYAVARLLMAELARAGVTAGTAALMRGEYAAAAGAVTLACVADGPFAPAIAWAAARCGAACVVFVPAGASQESKEALAGFGAALRDAPSQAGAALRHAVAEAAREGWLLLSDMSWAGYTEVPRDVMQGYRLTGGGGAGRDSGGADTRVRTRRRR